MELPADFLSLGKGSVNKSVLKGCSSFWGCIG